MRRPTIMITLAALAMLAGPAMAETPITRQLKACGKLVGVPYHACLDKVPNCKVIIDNPSLIQDPDSRAYWHKGSVFEITGGSDDPGQIAQHGGDRIPVSAVRFPHDCVLIGQRESGITYYHWEPRR